MDHKNKAWFQQAIPIVAEKITEFRIVEDHNDLKSASSELKNEIKKRLADIYLREDVFDSEDRVTEKELKKMLEDVRKDAFSQLMPSVMDDVFKRRNGLNLKPDEATRLYWGFHWRQVESKLKLFLSGSSLSLKVKEISDFVNKNRPELETKAQKSLEHHLKSKKTIIGYSEQKNKVWIFLFDQLAVAMYRESLGSEDKAWMADFLKSLVHKRMQKEYIDNPQKAEIDQAKTEVIDRIEKKDTHQNIRWNLNNILAIKLEEIWGRDYEKVKRPFSNKGVLNPDSEYNPFDHEPLNKPLKDIQRMIRKGDDLTTYLGFFLFNNWRTYFDKVIYETSESKNKNDSNKDNNQTPDNTIKSQSIYIDETSNIDKNNFDQFRESELKEALKEYIPQFLNAFFSLEPIKRLIILSVEDKKKEERPYIEFMKRYDDGFCNFTNGFSKLYDEADNNDDLFAIRLITNLDTYERHKELDPDKMRNWYRENIRRKAKKPFYSQLDAIMNAFKEESKRANSR